MKTKTATTTALMLMLVMSAGIHFVHADQPTRAQFAGAMNRVKIGMTAAEATDLLGKPDDVRNMPEGYKTEYWEYGTEGPDTFPTLGSLLISEGAVKAIIGGSGIPPDPAVLEEKELRKLLRLIDSAAWGRATRIWNGIAPLPLIRVVNTLQPLGKEKAMAALGEYVRLTQEQYAGVKVGILTSRDMGHIFLLLRLLYEIPDTGFMPLVYKTPADEKRGYTNDPKVFPLFPLALVDDIPLCLASRISTYRKLEEDLDYFQTNGKWRAHPLLPPDDPLASLDKLAASPGWKFTGPDPGRRKYELAKQLLSLIASVYPLEQNTDGTLVDDEPGNPQFDPRKWEKIKKEVAALHIRWDPARSIYVRGDGTTLPPPTEPPVYAPHVWWVPPLGFDGKMTVIRSNKAGIRVSTNRSQRVAVPVPDTVMKVYRDDTGEVIAQFHVAAEPGLSGVIGDSKYAKLPEGVSVHMEYTSREETTKMESCTP